MSYMYKLHPSLECNVSFVNDMLIDAQRLVNEKAQNYWKFMIVCNPLERLVRQQLYSQ